MSNLLIRRAFLLIAGVVGCLTLAGCACDCAAPGDQAAQEPSGYPIEIRYFDPDATATVSIESEVVGTTPMTVYLDIGRPIRIVVSESTGERAILEVTISESGGQSVRTLAGGVQLSGRVLKIIEAEAPTQSF